MEKGPTGPKGVQGTPIALGQKSGLTAEEIWSFLCKLREAREAAPDESGPFSIRAAYDDASYRLEMLFIRISDAEQFGTSSINIGDQVRTATSVIDGRGCWTDDVKLVEKIDQFKQEATVRWPYGNSHSVLLHRMRKAGK